MRCLLQVASCDRALPAADRAGLDLRALDLLHRRHGLEAGQGRGVAFKHSQGAGLSRADRRLPAGLLRERLCHDGAVLGDSAGNDRHGAAIPAQRMRNGRLAQSHRAMGRTAS